LKRQLSILLDELRHQLKKAAAPAELIDLASVSLQAGKSPALRSWLADTSYWLHWNAAGVLSSAGIKVDLVPLCIMDLSTLQSENVQMKAVRQLGEIGDKRAIPILKKIMQSPLSSPSLSLEAEKVLKEKFQ
jgi:HEAT repeat protein